MKRNILRVLVIAVVLGIVFGGWGIFRGIRSHNLTSTSNSFVQHVLANDSAASYGAFTPNEQGQLSSSDWKTTVKGLSIAFAKQSPQFSGQSSLKNYQIFTYHVLTADQNNTYQFTVVLVPAGGLGTKWQVQQFQSSKL